jgi:GNAT superfamily N-acetyltransferase
MHDIFRIRRATVQDADIIAWHRARMFQNMGDVSDDAFEILRAKARVRLKEWLESGDYIGWLATPADKPETVVGGAGVQLQPILPRPLNASTIGEGRQGTIVNVFTEPQWRRRGIAGLLVKRVHHLVEERADRPSVTSHVGRRPLSLRTARIHPWRGNVFRRRLLIVPLERLRSAASISRTLSLPFIPDGHSSRPGSAFVAVIV